MEWMTWISLCSSTETFIPSAMVSPSKTMRQHFASLVIYFTSSLRPALNNQVVYPLISQPKRGKSAGKRRRRAATETARLRPRMPPV
jgi:hypothetical protein